MHYTLNQLSALKCHRKNHEWPEKLGITRPTLEVCFNRREEVIALFCPSCHNFYVVVGMVPVGYPAKGLPDWQEPTPRNTLAESIERRREARDYEAGEIIGKALFRYDPNPADLHMIAEPGVLSPGRAKWFLAELTNHSVVIQTKEKLEYRKRKTNVYHLVPTWREIEPCDHTALCKGFWHGVKTGGK